jgi:hypothetical protein
MSEPVILDLKGRAKMLASKILDYSWNTSLVLTFGFGIFMMFIIIYGLAINYKIISPPPLLCHYMIGDAHMKDLCN